MQIVNEEERIGENRFAVDLPSRYRAVLLSSCNLFELARPWRTATVNLRQLRLVVRRTDNSSLTEYTARNRENIHDRELVNLNDFFSSLKLCILIYNKIQDYWKVHTNQ